MGRFITEKNRAMDQDGDKKAHATAENEIPCTTWKLEVDPIRLPNLPQLPSLPPVEGLDESEKPLQLIRIACPDNHVIGLTNKGHVLKFGVCADEATARRGRWEYVSTRKDISPYTRHRGFARNRKPALPSPLLLPA